jgi:hypothetical protein
VTILLLLMLLPWALAGWLGLMAVVIGLFN